MKKIISILLAVVLAMTTIQFAIAAGTPTITVSSATADPGDTVSLKVSLSNNPGINTFSLGFNYDMTRLSLTGVTLNSSVGGQFQYTKKAVWLNSSDSTYNGDYLTLTMKVLDNAPAGDASVAVTYNAGDISNYNEDDVDFTLVAGKVIVKATTPVSPGTITVGTATADPGTELTIPVSISGNPGINTFSLGFSYDTTRLNLKNVTLNSGLGGQFQYTKKAVWLNSSDSTYNGEILSLTFDVLAGAAAGDASVAVTYNAGDISNYNEDDVDFTLVSGKVTVRSQTPASSGTIAVGTATAAPGAEVTVPVSISNNPGINTFSLGFSYDTTRLNLKNVTLNSGLGGQFQYTKKAVWLNSSDTTYNGEILSLTFDVLENAPAGDANVAVTYNAGDISNYNEDDVDFELVDGKITVADDIPTSGGTIFVAQVVAKAGDEVEVPITISNNPGIIGMGLTVDYDAALSLVNVTDGGLLGSAMHGSNFSKKPYYLNWANDTATEDYTSNGVIATLTFKVAEGAGDGVYPITISYDNDDFEIFNYEAETVEFSIQNGSVEIKAYTIGDVNGDGKVNAQDRLILSRYIAKWDGYEERIVDMRAADVNSDGKVNAQDRLILSRYIAKWDGYSSYFEA